MENFSTPRVALLPRAANLATLAVVVAATWWSGAQRPLVTVPVSSQATEPAKPAAEPTTTANAATAAQWSLPATGLSRDGLQPVGFQARVNR